MTTAIASENNACLSEFYGTTADPSNDSKHKTSGHIALEEQQIYVIIKSTTQSFMLKCRSL